MALKAEHPEADGKCLLMQSQGLQEAPLGTMRTGRVVLRFAHIMVLRVEQLQAEGQITGQMLAMEAELKERQKVVAEDRLEFTRRKSALEAQREELEDEMA